jgi:hypothetical protein
MTNSQIQAWAEANPTFSFAQDMLRALRRFGSLTPNQEAAVERCMNRAAAPKPQIAVAGEGFAQLGEALNRAKARGLKHPCLVFAKFAFKLAGPKSKNPGCIYVTGGRRFGSTYFGKIDLGGRYSPSRDADATIQGEVTEVMKDPLASVVAHGRETGECACCGRQLIDPESVERGIGPICFDRYFKV